MFYKGKNIELGYAHRVINEDRFIYPILVATSFLFSRTLN